METITKTLQQTNEADTHLGEDVAKLIAPTPEVEAKPHRQEALVSEAKTIRSINDLFGQVKTTEKSLQTLLQMVQSLEFDDFIDRAKEAILTTRYQQKSIYKNYLISIQGEMQNIELTLLEGLIERDANNMSTMLERYLEQTQNLLNEVKAQLLNRSNALSHHVRTDMQQVHSNSKADAKEIALRLRSLMS